MSSSFGPLGGHRQAIRHWVYSEQDPSLSSVTCFGSKKLRVSAAGGAVEVQGEVGETQRCGGLSRAIQEKRVALTQSQRATNLLG